MATAKVEALHLLRYYERHSVALGLASEMVAWTRTVIRQVETEEWQESSDGRQQGQV